MKSAAEELVGFGDESQQWAVVRHSKANGYQGMVAPKINGHRKPVAGTKTSRTAEEIEDEIVVRLIRDGKSDTEILDTDGCQFVTEERVRAKRQELQHAEH